MTIMKQTRWLIAPMLLAAVSVVSYVAELMRPWNDYSEPHWQVVIAAIIIFGAPVLLLISVVWAVIILLRVRR